MKQSQVPDEGKSKRYAKVYARVTDNPLWLLSPACWKVFTGCLLKANYQDSMWYDGHKQILIPRGSFVTSIRGLAKFCHVSVKQTRGTLDHMESLHIATHSGTHRYSLITLLNYDKYNQPVNGEGHTEGHKVGHSEGTLEGNSVEVVEDVDIQRETLTSLSCSAQQAAPGKRLPKPDPLAGKIAECAQELHRSHPSRKCSLQTATEKLRSIAKLFPAGEAPGELDGIVARHQRWVDSTEWRKDAGQYVKGLEPWLNPVKGLWRNEPPAEVLTPAAAMPRAAPLTFSQRHEQERMQKFLRKAEDYVSNNRK